ncbi:hypothetical protein SDC9_151840 [bioreactor metagenome]|uniref:Uncharacterized protein n=1 Tax=bioreactor metagenome TaxID=1076179 RepID=A0A645ERD4_9ZZZZ
MLHQHDHAAHAGHQIHRTTRPLHHLAGDHPVRDIALVRHFQRAKDRKIHMTTTDHREGIRAGK